MSAAHAKAQEGPVLHRGFITICVMLATIMQALDTTIANVALPYMQGSLSVTIDQVSWVLTSYIVAAAIMYIGVSCRAPVESVPMELPADGKKPGVRATKLVSTTVMLAPVSQTALAVTSPS